MHNEDTGIFGTSTESEGITEAIRISQENQVENSTRIKVIMPGHSYIEAGDVVNFRLPSLEPNKGEKKGYQYDEFHSGRYVIAKLRHRVIRGEYKMVLELVKDSVYRKHSGLPNEYYSHNETPMNKSENIYKKDEFHMSNQASPGYPGNQ